MKRGRPLRWAGASAAALLALAIPSGPGRTAPDGVALAGTTLITAAGPSQIVIDVPRDIAYNPLGDSALLSVEGPGRAVAAALQPVASTAPTEALVVARFNGCTGPGCVAEAGSPSFDYRREASGARRAPDGRPLLAAGRHRLTVFTDGGEATVRLRAEGLSGETSASTASAVASGITTAAPALASPGSPIAWSGKADLGLPSANTLLLGFLQQDSPVGTVAGAAGACLFTGSSRPLLGVPAPGCPFQPNGGDGSAQVGSVATETLTLGSFERARMATMLTPVTGSQQAGLWSARGGPTGAPLAFFLWAQLD